MEDQNEDCSPDRNELCRKQIEAAFVHLDQMKFTVLETYA